MKIEIGESLLLSYLKHVKGCVLYQANWKASSNWGKLEGKGYNKAKEVYDSIIKQPEFEKIFKKSDFDQLIKQSEIDVIGMDFNKVIYACDIAFHEFGLQYGDKFESKDRVLKKLLRTYLTVLTYFPNYKYRIVFASPKVHKATESVINEPFEYLKKIFSNKSVTFFYYSNEKFMEEILEPTIEAAIKDSDTNELFVRAMILNNLNKKQK